MVEEELKTKKILELISVSLDNNSKNINLMEEEKRVIQERMIVVESV